VENGVDLRGSLATKSWDEYGRWWFGVKYAKDLCWIGCLKVFPTSREGPPRIQKETPKDEFLPLVSLRMVQALGQQLKL
jgi:hypothetical protein